MREAGMRRRVEATDSEAPAVDAVAVAGIPVARVDVIRAGTPAAEIDDPTADADTVPKAPLGGLCTPDLKSVLALTPPVVEPMRDAIPDPEPEADDSFEEVDDARPLPLLAAICCASIVAVGLAFPLAPFRSRSRIESLD
jgi:hypothetical protein